jgi:hypothetical protein
MPNLFVTFFSLKFKVVLVLSMFLLTVPFVTSQTRDLGSIRGCVVDSTGSYITEAAVTVTNESTGFSRSFRSDSSGCFATSGLPLTGRYTVNVAKAGFEIVERKSVDLQAGEAARLNFRLGVAGEKNEITVMGTAESLSTTPELSSVMDLGEIDSTPLLSRKITTLQFLDSSVKPARGSGDAYVGNPVFIVNGNGRRQTTFSIDNANADDSWGRQTIFTSIPFSSVQEFSVVTNAISAEYGRTTGAAINIVTKSGTNAWHGDLIGLWRPQALEAAAATAKIHVADTLAQGSGSVGGPLVKNRTYIMAAGEYSYQKRDAPMSSPLAPTLFKYTGEYEQALGLLRLDHRINNSNNLTMRLNFDRFSDTNPSDTISALTLPSAGRRFERNTYTAQLSETASLGSRTVNEARAQMQVASPIAQFTPYVPSVQFNRPGIGVEGESRSSSLLNHQYQFADTVLMSRGRHHLKFGADVIHSSTGGFGQEFGGGFVLGQFTTSSTKPIEQLTIADMSSYTQSFGNLNYHIGETIWALFMQDDFNVTRDLTLNLGLRYERQTFTDGEKNFAPRIGFAYKLPGDQETILRGSYSIFYSELRANLGAAFAINSPEGVFSYTATPGQPGFPTSLEPFPTVPTGVNVPPRDISVRPGDSAYLSQFFDVSKLRFYPSEFVNPYTQQWTLGMEHEIARNWIFSLDYTGQHTIHIDKPVDLNAPTTFVRTAPGQTRTSSAADATRPLNPTATGFRRIVATTNLGAAYYNGLQVKLTHRLSQRLYLLTSYTWSHAMNTVEWDGTGGQQEASEALIFGRGDLAPSLIDQRHRAVITASYALPWNFTVGTSSTFASARPYNPVTGSDNNGDTVRNDRPVINGVVAGRNSFRGSAFVDIATYVEKTFKVTERAQLSLRGEGFNLLNHNNLSLRNATYGNAASGIPAAAFGTALGGLNNADPSRQFQFQVRLQF